MLSICCFNILLTKNNWFLLYLGTQSPDAVNKLLRLSDSSHQVKTRAPQRPSHPTTSSSLGSTSTPITVSPLTTSSSTTATGLSSLAEPSHHRHQHHHHVTKMRDTNKLTSESSSLNFKQPTSTSYTQLIRSNTRMFHHPHLSRTFFENFISRIKSK